MHVRSAALAGYAPLAERLGLDVSLLLHRFGLPPAALRDPDRAIPYPAFSDLLEESAAQADCPDFGLRLADIQGIDILGPVTAVLHNACSVGEAIRLAARYLFVHSPALHLGLQPVPAMPGRVNVVFDIRHLGLGYRPQVTSLSLGIVCRGLDRLTAGRVRPREVHLPHPAVADTQTYRQAYRCSVRFAAPVACVQLRASDLQVMLSEHDPQVRGIVAEYLRRHTAADQSLVTRVRLLARDFLGTGQAGHARVAQALGLHPRTLQRRLSDEGTTFERLLDQLRQEQFLVLIAPDNGPGFTQIAHILGYAEASVLSRSCRRWFGMTPRALRERVRNGAPVVG